jgi:hypothetical protein
MHRARTTPFDTLTAFGLPPGPSGYDTASLRAAAEAHGLVADVEAIPGRHPGDGRSRACYQALVWRPQARLWGVEPFAPFAGHQAARARGRTEAEALAKALGSWLRRWGTGASAARRSPGR